MPKTPYSSWIKFIPPLNIVGYTDIGCERDTNEDAMAWDAGAGVVALADGMGGYRAGEVASAMAVSLFTNGFRCWMEEVGAYLAEKAASLQDEYIHNWLMTQVQSIHDSIIDAAVMIPDCFGMGTTFCGVVAWRDKVWIAHVGDSRIYAFDRETHTLRCLTKDHSVVQEQINEGLLTEESGRTSPHRHLLTRALGVGDKVEPDITVEPLSDNTVLMVCSDGLSDVVKDSLMVRVLRDHPLALAGRLLLSQANTLGGQDNISIILIDKDKSRAP